MPSSARVLRESPTPHRCAIRQTEQETSERPLSMTTMDLLRKETLVMQVQREKANLFCWGVTRFYQTHFLGDSLE